MAGEEECLEKHRDMEGEGKRREPRTVQFKSPGNTPIEEVRRHWTPKGCGPKDIQYKIKILYLLGLYISKALNGPKENARDNNSNLF